MFFRVSGIHFTVFAACVLATSATYLLQISVSAKREPNVKAATSAVQQQQKQRLSFTSTEFMRALEGEYVNNKYSAANQNNWHFVTLTQTGDGTLTWSNLAGVSWTLTATGYKDKLNVGTDCPYYDNGYTTATVEWDNTGTRVIGIRGAWNELYDADSYAEYVIDAMVGTYENHLYDDGGKNNWHYVTLTKVDARTLTWSNLAGASWSLSYAGVANTLNVGEDCPYYNNGHTTATITWKWDNVTGIRGPGKEFYDSDTFDNRVLSSLAGTYKHLVHSLTITNNGDRSLTWTSNNGQSWTLYYEGNWKRLKVGSDCPYYPAHSIAIARWNSDGLVKGIKGPFTTFYDADSYDAYVLGLLVGTYENHLYDNGGKNDWHYVTLAKVVAP